MAIDPTFGRPYRDFGPTSSFNEPVTAPLAGPFDPPYYQAPCINVDWYNLLLGAASQLENPATWRSFDNDAVVLAAVQAAQELRAGMGAKAACVNPIVDVTFGSCSFTLHFADGSSRKIVDWDGTIQKCVQGWIPPTPPANPRGISGDQYACNLAGFLSTKLIEATMQQIASAFTSGQTVQQFLDATVPLFAVYLPLTAIASVAFGDFYAAAVTQALSEVQAAAADPTLWAEVTCTIFNAIRADGAVDASNFAAVGAALGAMSYSLGWVPIQLAAFWTNIGLPNWENAQQEGAFDDVDCSGCSGGWCHEWDFTVSDGGWFLTPAAPFGAYIGGQGWVTTPDIGAGIEYLSITSPAFAFTGNVFGVAVFAQSTAYTGIGGNPREWYTYHSGVLVNSDSFPNTAYPARTKITSSGLGAVCDTLLLQWSTDTGPGAGAVISKIQVLGNGVDPFGLNNCTE